MSVATDSWRAAKAQVRYIQASYTHVLSAVIAVLVSRMIGGPGGWAVAGLLILIGTPVFSRPFGRHWRTCPECLADQGPPERIMGQSRAENFWASLSHVERTSLLAVAGGCTFSTGQILFREAELARHVYIVRQGQVQISVARQEGGRRIAVRGPGEIIGERAALQVRPRSAAGVALTPVRALVVATEVFAAFVEQHPRVLDLLERQLYSRLTEVHDDPLVPAVPAVGPSWTGQNCTVFYADVAGFGGQSRNDPDRRMVRCALYRILREVFRSSGVEWGECHREDRGDGVLIIVPPCIPTSLLIDPLAGQLARALAAYNQQAADPERIQLRVALHVGPIVSDPHGVSGESILQAARILEAPVLKRELAAGGADLGVIVSGFVHDSVLRHLPRNRWPGKYRSVRLRVKESALTAWMCTMRYPPAPGEYPWLAAAPAAGVGPAGTCGCR
jgi:Cyclic nucleotide-binding domain